MRSPILGFRNTILRGCAIAATALSLATTGAAESKPWPQGVYALIPSWNSNRKVELSRPAWSNPVVRGVRVRAVWENMEARPGGFNWSYFDEAASLAERNGKTAGLSLAAGIFTPDWVYSEGAARFDFTSTGRFRPTKAEAMPEPWDEHFLKAWGATVRAMGERYDKNPRVAYVVMGGLGTNIESFFVKTPEDIARFKSMGGTAKWLEGAKRVVDLYAEAFPTTPFFYAMAWPIKNDWSGTRELVEYGVSKYPGRFGIMHNGLNAAAESSLYPNEAIQKYAGKIPTGYQMVWSTVGSEGAQRVKGSLSQALARGAQFNGRFIEVYEEDTQNPSYSSDLRDAGQHLQESSR